MQSTPFSSETHRKINHNNGVNGGLAQTTTPAGYAGRLEQGENMNQPDEIVEAKTSFEQAERESDPLRKYEELRDAIDSSSK